MLKPVFCFVDDWVTFGWTQIQCFTKKDNSKFVNETGSKVGELIK